MKPRGWLLTVVLLLGTAPLAAAQSDKIDRYIRIEMKKRQIPGVALAVIKDGRLVKRKGYGLANVELNVPVTSDTVFDLASLTKQFTATAILLLAEEGKLGLDDKIGRYLPNAPATWDAITVRHLLTHTSGLNFSYLPMREEAWLSDYKAALLFEYAAKLPFKFAPGDGWSYSNQGYVLLAMIIEKVSGKRYGDFLRDRIFTRLGMNATRMLDQWEIVLNRAAGYTLRGGKLAHIRRSSQIEPGGPEGMLSTVEDLAKWDAALNSEGLLKLASLDQMWTPVKLNNGLTHNYGFGWFLDEFRGHRMVGHPGGTGTHILRLPEDTLTVIVLSNIGDTAESDPWSLARAVAGMYLPGLSLSAVPAQSDPNPQRTQRIWATLSDIAQGNMDSPLLTREAAAGLPPWIRWGMVTWLKDARSFTFIACDDVQHRGLARYGVSVSEVCYYKLMTPLGTPYFWKFYLTAEGKVADLSAHAE